MFGLGLTELYKKVQKTVMETSVHEAMEVKDDAIAGNVRCNAENWEGQLERDMNESD